MTAPPTIQWTESGQQRSARWRSENDAPPPQNVVIGDDQFKADTAYKLACEGTAILWRGDFHNAKQLLQAMARRVDGSAKRKASPASKLTANQAFHQHRQAQGQRARVLGMVLLPFDANHHLPLRRAPDLAAACTQAYGPDDAPYVVSLREVMGLVGAFEWRKNGVKVPALGSAIHPHYGVFSPIRGEYLDLITQVPLPSTELAFDIGTGTGVIAAMLARRGVKKVVATDMSDRALACAQDNLDRLGFAQQVDVVRTDLFPPGQAPLIVCNPPWLPGRAHSPVEHAVYDPNSQMLLGFLNGLAAHLSPQGEGWLIMSDLAEHLGLRAPDMLTQAIDQAGLQVRGKVDIRPRHGKAQDPNDPLHQARKREVTSLWRLGAKPAH